MALGIFISMKIFRIPDITTDGSFTLGAALTAVLLLHDVNVFLAIPIVIIIGALAGVVTGLIHTRLKIDALLSGILVMTGLYSINLSIMQRSNIPMLDVATVFNFLPQERVTEWMMSIGFTTLMVAVTGFILKSDFGIAMRATGNSEPMSKAMGINTNAMKLVGLAMANALTALSGYLVSQYQGFADINMGIGIVISGLAAVLIGDTLGKQMRITNIWVQLVFVVLGSIVFQLVLAAVLSTGVHPNMLKLATAIFVLIIVALPKLTSKEHSV
jgi:putative ABC transport system permease protein